MTPGRTTLTDSEVKRVRDAMDELKRRLGSDIAAAAAIGVDQSTYSRNRKERRPGVAFAERLASGFGQPPDFFRDHFRGERVEVEDQYPARANAARAARLVGVDERAIAKVLADKFAGAERLTEKQWLDMMRAEEPKLAPAEVAKWPPRRGRS